jgi:hypothetical protein
VSLECLATLLEEAQTSKPAAVSPKTRLKDLKSVQLGRALSLKRKAEDSQKLFAAPLLLEVTMPHPGRQLITRQRSSMVIIKPHFRKFNELLCEQILRIN